MNYMSVTDHNFFKLMHFPKDCNETKVMIIIATGKFYFCIRKSKYLSS